MAWSKSKSSVYAVIHFHSTSSGASVGYKYSHPHISLDNNGMVRKCPCVY